MSVSAGRTGRSLAATTASRAADPRARLASTPDTYRGRAANTSVQTAQVCLSSCYWGILGDWANFGFFWEFFSKIFKHRVQDFYHQVH